MTDHNRSTLTYDVVIATKDRPHLIPFSLGSLLEQTIPPNQIILIDASDNHQRIVQLAESCCEEANTTSKLTIIPHRPWQAAQRNEGMRHATAPIAFIPDDDSILLPDAAEQVLRVYERDADQQIGGVGMKETRTPPPSVRSDDAQQARKAGPLDRIIYRLSATKARWMHRFVKSPLRVACDEMRAQHTPPNWLDAADAVPSACLHGFRMTFRTDIVKRYGFHEDLARGRGFDDMDISLNVMQTHLLVTANRAHVYHHRMGGQRDDALEAGLTQLLNPCYITCRHRPPDSPARRAIKPYARRLMVDYGLRAMSRYDRERLRGIRLARKWLSYLLDASPEMLTERYQHAFNEARHGRTPTPQSIVKESAS